MTTVFQEVLSTQAWQVCCTTVNIPVSLPLVIRTEVEDEIEETCRR